MGDTILSKIEQYARETPDKICLIDAIKDEKLTYKEFWNCILRYAKSVPKGKYFILQTRQNLKHLIAFYGIQVAGSVAIPVEASASNERLEELAKQFGAIVLPIDYELGEEKAKFIKPDPEDIACVICTTGTTGKSKGVLSSFRCRFSGADNVRYSYEITSDDVALIPQVFSHSGGLRRIEAMLVSGATAVTMGSAMLFGNVFAAIKKYKCNILQLVPAQVAQILNKAEKMLVEVSANLRIVSVGSAVIPEYDKERLRKLLPGVRLFNDFGSTEAVGSAYFEWSAYEAKANCVGEASLHSRIVFLDDNGNIMEKTSKNNPGILATEGDTLMSGYLNDSELTNKTLQNGRVISADLGYEGEDGLIYILGRRDDVIVCGGNKIAPAEVEDVVLRIDGVKECACVPKSDEVMGQMPALFVVLKAKSNLKEKDISTFMAKYLEGFKVVRNENIHFLSDLPKSEGTSKVLKKELQKILESI